MGTRRTSETFAGGGISLSAATLEQLRDTLRADRYAAASSDAFGRMRVGESVIEADIKFTDDLQPLYFNAVTVGTGAIAHEDGPPKTTRANLSVTSASDAATLRSRSPYQYRAGQSQLVAMTGSFGAAEAGITYRMGYFDGSDGLYLQQSGAAGTPTFVVRDSFTSTEVEAVQSSWNLDTLDGTGGTGNPSGYELDVTKSVIFCIDMQYLGVGRVRFGFYSDEGELIWCHFRDLVGVSNAPYMRTANLPITWQVEASAAYGGAGKTMYAHCVSAIREGAHEEPGLSLAVDTGGAALISTPTALTTALSVRIKDGYDTTAVLRPLGARLYNEGSNALYWQLVRMNNDDAPAGVTGGAWTSRATGAASEYSTVAAAVTPTARDVVYASGFVAPAGRAVLSGVGGTGAASVGAVIPTGLDSGGDADILMLLVREVGSGGSDTYAASLLYEEFS